MTKLLLSFLMFPFFAMAQKQENATEATGGTHFEHKVTNWDNIIIQAKKENKYVFVDCYTTWCGPCKYVSSTIFPMKNVGNFFNKNFVNVGLQIDQIKEDNEDVIATRSVAKQIETTYKINAYPTFLIFDNTGKLVHKFCGAGDDKFMIANATAGLDKDEQYYTLVEKFGKGTRDGNFITKLCKASAAAGDNAEEYLKAFIETQTNLFTKENAELLLSNVENTDGIAFKNLYANKEKWLQVTDKGKFDEAMVYAIRYAVYDLFPKDKNEKINWSNITEAITKKYPNYSNVSVTKVKVMYLLRNEDWKDFEETIKSAILSYPNMFNNDGEYNTLAWAIFENINNKNLLNQALIWSKKSLEKGKDNPMYLDTYANILYKLGQVKEAIEIETKALELIDVKKKKEYQETLNKMKAGKPTWK